MPSFLPIQTFEKLLAACSTAWLLIITNATGVLPILFVLCVHEPLPRRREFPSALLLWVKVDGAFQNAAS
jgi:hypothetical protein